MSAEILEGGGKRFGGSREIYKIINMQNEEVPNRSLGVCMT